jgi:lipopolysaccharide export system permease protein
MILDRYIVKSFIPIFIFAIAMFVMLLLLIDLFLNLVHYLNYDAAIKQILTVSLYYIPKGVLFALPISLLFAVAYTLGDLYARNELTSIISSGIPFWRFAAPLLIIGASVSLFSFYFEDHVVIPTLKIKNDMGRELRHQSRAENNSDIVIKTRGGERIYSVDYYDYVNLILNGISIIEQDEQGRFISQIRASQAKWVDEHWEFSNAIIYQWEDEILRVGNVVTGSDYTDDPEIFRRSAVNPEDLSAKDTKGLVHDLQSAGLPYIGALADYYHRFSFSSVSFIVVILSISMGGRFRKNIMLMSLLTSLSAAVVFYIIEMITMMLARLGYIPPIVGAWFPVVVFTIAGIILTRFSKT